MIIKLLWYLLSLLAIVLILITVPSQGSVRSSMNQNQSLIVRSGQVLIKKIIIFTVLMFFIFSILLLINS